MLGKAYLWQKKYSDAATEFENVIKTELFDLNPDLTNFGTPDAVAGIEDVFVMRAVNDAATTSPNVTYHGMVMDTAAQIGREAQAWRFPETRQQKVMTT